MGLLGSIRENIMMGRFFNNHPLMISFDKNIKELTALLAALPLADVHTLPVQVTKEGRASGCMNGRRRNANLPDIDSRVNVWNSA